MNESAFQKFKHSFESALLKTHKSIIWLECFDYCFIVDMINEICHQDNSGLKLSNIRVWNNADRLDRCLNGKKIPKYKKDKNGDFVEGSKGKYSKYEKEKYDGQDRYSKQYPKRSLDECILNFIATNSSKLLIARVMPSLFDNDKGCIIASLQEFVYQNNKEPEDNKRTILIIASNHFDIVGLEHICERMSMPLPDIEDIDEEFGLIQDAELKTRRDENNTISPKEDCIIHVGDDVVDLVTSKESEEGTIKIKEEKIGFVRRNANGIVERIFLPKDGKYKFSSGFLSSLEEYYDDKKRVVNFETRYQELVESLCGMHLYDIKELLHSIVTNGNGMIKSKIGNDTLIKYIREKKKQLANNTGLLEIVEYEKNYHENVADIDNLMNHIDSEKKRIDNPSLYPPKLSQPKGILLVGAPGCGKSESAKAIASKLDKPLYRLNIGNLLGHKYGQSENRFIEALRTADASAPCVLWIDEIEKAFAGAGNESENDDTLTHIVGHFLTWMQEHKTMVYLVATANDVSRMKPEMLRKGRWDETFYLNYPTKEGCISIIKTIIENKLEMKLIDKEKNIDSIAEKMCRIPMSGAEIENAIAETIKMHPKYENGEWCIYTEDFALTLQEMSKSLSDTKREGSKEENEANDLFLRTKVDKEIQDMKIRSCGRISVDDEKRLRKLLVEKYKNMYSFKPASTNLN